MEGRRREPGGNRPAFHGSENGVRHARETQGRGNAASRGRLDGRRSASAGESRAAGSPIPRVLPPAPPSVAPGTVIPPPSAPGAEVPNRPVHVSSVEVEGVTAYPQPEIAQLAAGLVGPAVPLPQIDAARQAILQRYRSDGYVLTTVSANLDANGRLRFVVTEGRIASVKLDGDIGPAGTQVLRFLNRLTEKQPIDSVTLERYLLLAQDVPGVSLRAVLEPSADKPGALNLIAQVSRQQVSRPRHDRQPRLQPDRADRVARRARLQQLHRVRREDRALLLPHLPEQPEFRPGLDRGVHRRVRPEGEDLWRLRRHRRRPAAGPAGLQRHHDSVRQFAELPGDPLAAADAERQLSRSTRSTPTYRSPRPAPRASRRATTRCASCGSARTMRCRICWLGADRSAINGLSVRLSQGLKLLGRLDQRRFRRHRRGRASRPASPSSTSRRAARRRCSRRGRAPASG